MGDLTPWCRWRVRPGRAVKIWCAFLVCNTVLGALYAQVASLPTRTISTFQLTPAGTVRPPGRARRDADDEADAPAMRSYPWRRAYFDEYSTLPYQYEPFLTTRVATTRGHFVNVSDGVRLSWQAPRAAGAHRPTVWFMGGSTLFGLGQRDGHTIPSMVARRAAATGHPIDVVNMGVPAYTNYQEVLAFEQMLASRPAPDVVVFYDGVNDLTVQFAWPTGQPGVYPSDVNLSPRNPSAYARYQEISLVHLLWRRYSPFASAPAGAAEANPKAMDDAQAVLAYYRRGLTIAKGLAARHSVRLVAFWQPARFYAGDPATRIVRAHLPAGVVDVSRIFDGRDPDDIYLDPAHTNELGARLVADRMWPAIERQLP